MQIILKPQPKTTKLTNKNGFVLNNIFTIFVLRNTASNPIYRN